MNILFLKFKEVLSSVLPIAAFVIILHFTLIPLPTYLFLRFLIGTVFIIVGLSIFLLGVELGITPLGNHVGSSLSKSNKLIILAAVTLVVGFFISIAEPDLQILADQVSLVTGGALSKMSIVTAVSIGIGSMLTYGLIRIVFNIKIHVSFLILYGAIMIMSFFVKPEFLAIAFDASGATTGALTVPFILNLAIGVSVLKKNSRVSEQDSFGLVGITSTGAILGILMMGLFTKTGELQGNASEAAAEVTSVMQPFVHHLPTISFESLIALGPIAIIFILFQIFSFKFNLRTTRKIFIGILYTLIGLILFLTGVNAGFMEVGTELGSRIAQENQWIVVAVGFALGLVTIFAEPAVHVLTHQIETVTSGSIKRGIIFAALSIGVGTAVALAMIRILVPGIELWHYLLPG
ncbi:MAG: DUF1538 domain-containing protein, partial [Treponema sp.]|nr:DUF1538 domain-containing protein [Treponema sp.]